MLTETNAAKWYQMISFHLFFRSRGRSREWESDIPMETTSIKYSDIGPSPHQATAHLARLEAEPNKTL